MSTSTTTTGTSDHTASPLGIPIIRAVERMPIGSVDIDETPGADQPRLNSADVQYPSCNDDRDGWA